jgi:hypothetical protein
MEQKDREQFSQQEQTKSCHDAGSNMLRSLSMLKKAVGRLVRQTYQARSQYPTLFFQIETAIEDLRAWVRRYRFFSGLSAFQVVFDERLQALRQLIGQLQEHCRPCVKSKNRQKSRPYQAYRKLCRAIEKMLSHRGSPVPPCVSIRSVMEWALEGALRTAVDRLREFSAPRTMAPSVSQRGERTTIFAWSQPEGYLELVMDAKRFRREVIEALEQSRHGTGHCACCKEKRHYTLIGFRSQPRKTLLPGGQQAEFPIRMMRCSACGAKFSLLPSFLAREKHFALDIIGHAVNKLVLFGQSLQATLADLTILVPGGHSKQTLLDWLTWFGTLAPATILTRAGIQGTGYFQEDEGFEKESGLRTYTVALVEPETLLVWHLDYVDAVNEEMLCESFEQFVDHIRFHVLGVTKDTWQPSTKALKHVFHALWIEFCHRHELKKWRQALSAYQDETHCSATERQRLYRRIKTLLDTAESSVVLKLKLKTLEREETAFQHPILRKRLKSLNTNAVRYTSHHKRNGLTKTTSIVDNFLKLVKRKLRQVESFRDQECTRIFFRAMATVRNFVPFLSGAKNAHQSPFMLAQGETYGLPWIQVMNIHNAFVFTDRVC